MTDGRDWSCPTEFTCAEVVTALPDLAALINPTKFRTLRDLLQPGLDDTDVSVLQQLVKRNQAQHRSTPYFQKLQQVLRIVRQLARLALPAIFDDLIAILQQHVVQTPGTYKRSVALPCREAGVFMLTRLKASITLYAGLQGVVVRCCRDLLAQLAASYFMPLCLTAASLCARLRVCAAAQLLRSVELYNSVLPMVAAFPRSRFDNDAAPDLPFLFKVTWQQGLPRLDAVPFEEGASLTTMAAHLAERYELVQSSCSLPVAAPTVGALTLENAAQKLTAHERAGVGLAVIEDKRRAADRNDEMAAPLIDLPHALIGGLGSAVTARQRAGTEPPQSALTVARAFVAAVSARDAIDVSAEPAPDAGQPESTQGPGASAFPPPASDARGEAVPKVSVSGRDRSDNHLQPPLPPSLPGAGTGSTAAPLGKRDWRALLEQKRCSLVQPSSFVTVAAPPPVAHHTAPGVQRQKGAHPSGGDADHHTRPSDGSTARGQPLETPLARTLMSKRERKRLRSQAKAQGA